MSKMFSDFDPIIALASIAALLIAVIGHEIMHGAAAYMYGDTTAKNMGRFSVNPIKHIDPIGTIVLPLLLTISGAKFLFGWAKPVPINVNRVLGRGGHKAMIVVSLAGVAYNFLAAGLAAGLLHLLSAFGVEQYFLTSLLIYLIRWNVVLAVFNLLPIPPLDGANAIAHSAAAFGFYGVGRALDRLGAWGFIILIVIMATGAISPIFTAMQAIVKAMIGI
ncbi:MAG: site-2 protease family protein [Helicobacteraceae bacterium]|jgi:Zn-dependent protease|nr:site-2 protease family protein [Helicobacteraceae bacterium]